MFSVKDILGYSRNEIMGNWFGRFLATNDLEKFETIRQKYCNWLFILKKKLNEIFYL